jgi:hypothetical protein
MKETFFSALTPFGYVLERELMISCMKIELNLGIVTIVAPEKCQFIWDYRSID